MLDEMRGSRALEQGAVQFVRAGTPAGGAFQCVDCGYGVAVQAVLPQCPMCAGTSWERVARSGVWRSTTRPLD